MAKAKPKPGKRRRLDIPWFLILALIATIYFAWFFPDARDGGKAPPPIELIPEP
jgi:hypothetical protein